MLFGRFLVSFWVGFCSVFGLVFSQCLGRFLVSFWLVFGQFFGWFLVAHFCLI